jgi:hypothetical protein
MAVLSRRSRVAEPAVLRGGLAAVARSAKRLMVRGSQNRRWSPRCGTMWSTTVAGCRTCGTSGARPGTGRGSDARRDRSRAPRPTRDEPRRLGRTRRTLAGTSNERAMATRARPSGRRSPSALRVQRDLEPVRRERLAGRGELAGTGSRGEARLRRDRTAGPGLRADMPGARGRSGGCGGGAGVGQCDHHSSLSRGTVNRSVTSRGVASAGAELVEPTPPAALVRARVDGRVRLDDREFERSERRRDLAVLWVALAAPGPWSLSRSSATATRDSTRASSISGSRREHDERPGLAQFRQAAPRTRERGARRRRTREDERFDGSTRCSNSAPAQARDDDPRVQMRDRLAGTSRGSRAARGSARTDDRAGSGGRRASEHEQEREPESAHRSHPPFVRVDRRTRRAGPERENDLEDVDAVAEHRGFPHRRHAIIFETSRPRRPRAAERPLNSPIWRVSSPRALRSSRMSPRRSPMSWRSALTSAAGTSTPLGPSPRRSPCSRRRPSGADRRGRSR